MNKAQRKLMIQIGMIVATAVTFSACVSSDSSFDRLVETQLARYPEMQVQDWYKLLHQAAMGNRHLGVEDSAIYRYLLDELDRIDSSPHEPLIEYIAPDSSVIRLNLRPFKALGGNPDSLFAAMKATWNTMTPSMELLGQYQDELETAAGLPFDKAETAAYFSTRRAEGFPAVHHSDRYESAYQPAYRVLSRQFLPSLSN